MGSKAASRLTCLLTRFIPPGANSVAAAIPLDIFVDNISPYLQVEDILALRRVNKHYFHLTHEPLIWKRFLQALRIPVPPIRPTLDRSVRSSDYEFEQLVSRAISLEDNWRKDRPTVASTMSFDASLEVLDMKLLPGGKYLIASVRDDYRFFIALYHLDHPRGPHILARCQTPTKAYKLQAQYMRYEGKPVIMIAYVCRVLQEGAPANIDPAQFANNANVDPSAPIFHILNCVHIDLSTLDLLAGAHRDPTGSETTKHKLWLSDARYKPFTQTVSTQFDNPIKQLSLYSREGVPHLSLLAPVADLGDHLTIINIEHPLIPTILVFGQYTYEYDPDRSVNPLPQMKQYVRAVRHLPEQNHVLIWRTILICELPDYNQGRRRWVQKYAHGLELVPMGKFTHDGSATIATPLCGHLVLLDGTVENVYMTDDLWPYDGQSDFPLQGSSQPPPPISIFAEMTKPQGILHWHLWPDRGPARDGPRFIYDPYEETVTKQTMYNAHPCIGHVLPGVFRSLIYTTESTDRTATPSLISLRRYVSPEFQTNTYRIQRVERQSTVERCQYPKMPRYVYTTIDLGREAAAKYRDDGLGVIAWDEAIGRVCMATGGGSIIEVMDFSHAVKPGERFLDWKMSSRGGFEYLYEHEEDNEFALARRSRLKRYPHLVPPSDEDVDMDDDDRSVISNDSYYK